MPTSKKNNDDLSTEDIESLFQLITTMNQSLLAQGRSMTNTLATAVRTLSDLHSDLQKFMAVNDMTREKRMEEEIDALEQQLAVLNKQLEDKRNAKVDLKSTTDKVRTVAREELAERDRKRSIDWQSTKQTAVNATIAALAVAILWGIIINLPAFAEGLRVFLGK